MLQFSSLEQWDTSHWMSILGRPEIRERTNDTDRRGMHGVRQVYNSAKNIGHARNSLPRRGFFHYRM
jgi:hypothetical protein